jgi:ferric-dicitrate binding protein FerR (iron transport regulator)
MQNEVIISKYLSENCSAAEKEEFEKKLLSDSKFKSDFEKYREIWNSVNTDEPEGYSIENEWDHFENRIQEGEKSKTKLYIYRTLQIAAVITLLVVSGYWLTNKSTPDDQELPIVATISPLETQLIDEPEEFQVMTSDYDKTIVLPDSTVVNLKVGSKIVYDEKFNMENREIYLEGAALFDVKRDTTCNFRIRTENTVTNVLGTSFLLRAYPSEDSVSIMVRSGLVEFGKDETDKFYLEKGDYASYSRTKDSIDIAYDFIAETVTIPKKQVNKKAKPSVAIDRGILKVDYDWHKTALNLSKVEGKIINESTTRTYDNIRVKITYFTEKKGKKASTYFMLEDSVAPGETVEFKKTLMLDWLSKTSEIEVEIDTAETNRK